MRFMESAILIPIHETKKSPRNRPIRALGCMAIDITDRDADLDRQLKSVRKGETETVVCPWCGLFGNEDSGECCISMEDAKRRLGELHLKSLNGQFSGARNGLRDESVQCPYCDAINRPENMESPAHWKRPGVSPYCCDSMVFAVMVLGERLMIQAQIDHARRIQDGISKASAN